MVWSDFGVNSMNPWILLAAQVGGGGLMLWGMFSWHTFSPLIPPEYCLNDISCLSIVVDHMHPFMAIIYPSHNGYIQYDNAPCHKSQVVLHWSHENGREFSVL